MLLYVPKALINLTMEASDVHSYNTRYASKQSLYTDQLLEQIMGYKP
jgi:hypothetical protein